MYTKAIKLIMCVSAQALREELKMEKKRAIFIDGRREAYCPNQCYNTMSVGELKEFLEQFDDDDEVFLRNDNGYTYGEISEYTMNIGNYNNDGNGVIFEEE